jgi:erythromycin esterase-like protein/dienelactone hydrolase
MADHAVLADEVVHVDAGDVGLEGNLSVPDKAIGVILFAHGSGSSRHSRRNRQVAETLREAGLATLLIDLLTTEEEQVDRVTAHLRFDIPMLAGRLIEATRWLARHPKTNGLRIGYFGASTGAGAALIAAAEMPDRVSAVVSRGGRPDLAAEALPRVKAPTLLIVGERDTEVIELNRAARAKMRAETEISIVPGAGHLFEEPGTLDRVAELAGQWFVRYLGDREADAPVTVNRGGHGNGDGDGHGHASGAARPRVFRSKSDRAALIAEAAEPFADIEDADMDALLDRIGDAAVVLIGEASHGTSEFYRMRQEITRALVERRGFNTIAVEADWPDAEHVDEYVRGREPRLRRAAQAFDRFPNWMWRNHEVLGFVEWLREYNAGVAEQERKVGFFGLDIYSLYSSIHEVLRYLGEVDPALASLARERYNCLTPFKADPARYGKAVVTQQYRGCEEEVTQMLQELLQKRLESAGGEGERLFDAKQNARVIAGAERYYRTMYYGSPDSWNLRDGHMFATLQALLEFRGPDARAVVWAHNSHVGNAAATSMSTAGLTNVGEISREEFGDNAFLIGFGTNTGTVAAASNWGGEVEIKSLRASHPDSYERLCHESGVERFFLPLREPRHADIRHELGEPRLERAIGVIYRPETELQSHYFRAVLPDQFDEYIWFDHSEAVHPLDRTTAPELPARHPFLLID